MYTHFTFRHMESSDALRQYAEDRLEKVKRYFSDPIRVNTTFCVSSKTQHNVEFDVVLRNGIQLHASETTENMYSSVDLALAKMERQVRRFKDRIRHHKRHENETDLARVRLAVIAAEAVEADIPDQIGTATEETPPAPGADEVAARIVEEQEIVAKSLTVDQAIMQMNLLHDVCYVFTNAQTGAINVVYRREDKNYGLIETSARAAPG